MYLRRISLENCGPIEHLVVELRPAAMDRAPMPLILVGVNGSGKTSLLSMIGDAFYEMLSSHFDDVVPKHSANGISRPFFRIVGGLTRSAGKAGGFAVLEFVNDDITYNYVERSGSLPDQAAAEPAVAPFLTAGNSENSKTFEVSRSVARQLAEQSFFVFFPSSRFETPYWLNTAAVEHREFDTARAYEGLLRRPVYLEQGLHKLEQWMLSLVLDLRADFQDFATPDGSLSLAVGDLTNSRSSKAIWIALNEIIAAVTGDANTKFVYTNRHAGVAIRFTDGKRVLPLAALSAGQSTLLNIFGTLMRYGDQTTSGAWPGGARGICVVDEIDAHMHVDLQYRALPTLMKMFPQVQFVVSGHSPLFVLGVRATYPTDESPIVIEMPAGTVIDPEAYSEFYRALNVVRETAAFSELLEANLPRVATGKLLVLCEGETDPRYIVTAANVLGRDRVADGAVFEWVGSYGPGNTATNTGKDGLNAALRLLQAKPNLVDRPVALLYDADTNKTPQDLPSDLYVRTVPNNSVNNRVKSGIESLLVQDVFVDEVFDVKETLKSNGDLIVHTQLNKVRLCDAVCGEPTPEVFGGFAALLDVIEELLLGSS